MSKKMRINKKNHHKKIRSNELNEKFSIIFLVFNFIHLQFGYVFHHHFTEINK